MGKDTLTGCGGADVFLWSSVDEIGLSNLDPDIVTDFNRQMGDLLDFSLIDADETVAGSQAFTFIGNTPFTAAGQINFVNVNGDAYIQLNTNADPTLDGSIQVFGPHLVDANWLVL